MTVPLQLSGIHAQTSAAVEHAGPLPRRPVAGTGTGEDGFADVLAARESGLWPPGTRLPRPPVRDVPPTGVAAYGTGPDLAQHLRLLVSDLWGTMGDRVPDDLPRERLRRPIRRGWWSTRQDLAASEHVLAAYTHRITRVLDPLGTDDVPFLATPYLRVPPVADELGVEVLLRRVSPDVERFARLLETLRPGDWDREWRSELGLSAMRQLVEEAVTLLDAHLKAAALSARMALYRGIPSGPSHHDDVPSDPTEASRQNDVLNCACRISSEMSRWS